MIHIATVHWGSSYFQEIQFNFICKNLSNFKIWTFLDRINDGSSLKNEDMYHFFGESGVVNHLDKLDMLASRIFKESKDDDVILFMDGDAWPVVPMDEVIYDCLSKYSLGAVVRKENNERHAHPSFCFTTVGLWRDLEIKWRGGFIGNHKYDVTFPSAKLHLNAKEWLPFYRTDGLSSHRVFFSIYGDKIYHHGAGFRAPVSAWCRGKGMKMTKQESLDMLSVFESRFKS